MSQVPEICRTNLANVILALKSMGIDEPHAIDWLDPPEEVALRAALRSLFLLGALDADGSLTSIGATMSRLPVEPCLSRVLLAASELGCVDVSLSVCAMVGGDDPFHRAGRIETLEAARAARQRYESPEGDHMTLLRVYEDWAALDARERDGWCSANGLDARALRTACSVRTQLRGMLHAARVHCPEDCSSLSSAASRRRCREALCFGYFFQAARRMRGTQVFVTLATPQQTVSLRSGSSGSMLQDADYVIFSELVWAGRVIMQRATAVQKEWLDPFLPLLNCVDVDRLMGAGRFTTKLPVPSDHEIMGSSSGKRTVAESAGRRNDTGSVSRARERFLERQRQRQRTV